MGEGGCLTTDDDRFAARDSAAALPRDDRERRSTATASRSDRLRRTSSAGSTTASTIRAPRCCSTASHRLEDGARPAPEGRRPVTARCSPACRGSRSPIPAVDLDLLLLLPLRRPGSLRASTSSRALRDPPLREEHGVQTTMYPPVHRFTSFRETCGEVPRSRATERRRRRALLDPALPTHHPSSSRSASSRRSATASRQMARPRQDDTANEAPRQHPAVRSRDRRPRSEALRIQLADDGSADPGARGGAFSATTPAPRTASPPAAAPAGLHLACLAAGVGPGDEVIVPGGRRSSPTRTPTHWCGGKAVFARRRSPPTSRYLDVEAVEALMMRAHEGCHRRPHVRLPDGPRRARPPVSAKGARSRPDRGFAVSLPAGVLRRTDRSVGTRGATGVFSVLRQDPVARGGRAAWSITDDEAAAATDAAHCDRTR